jgi:hypothetical protein
MIEKPYIERYIRGLRVQGDLTACQQLQLVIKFERKNLEGLSPDAAEFLRKEKDALIESCANRPTGSKMAPLRT